MTEVINLKKGEVINLTKKVPTLKKVHVGAGWDMKDEGKTMDADLCVFLLDANGKTRSADDFIYFGKLNNAAKTVVHQGDNLTGEGEGDDEVIDIDLETIDSSIHKVAIYMDIYQAAQKGQTLADLDNAFVRIVNSEGNFEISKYEITEPLTGDLMLFGELYRFEGGWEFKAVGSTRTAELSQVVAEYGLQAAA